MYLEPTSAPTGMQAVTVRQPWAWATAHGRMPVLSRRFPCPAEQLGADIALNAGTTRDGVMILPAADATQALLDAAIDGDTDPALTLGAVVALIRVTACHQYRDAHSACGDGRVCDPWARPVPGRWHWSIAPGPQLLGRPVRCKGSDGLWLLPPAVAQAVRAQFT